MRAGALADAGSCPGACGSFCNSQLVELGHSVRTCFETKVGAERRLWWAVMASEVALARLEDQLEHSFLRFLKRLEASWR